MSTISLLYDGYEIVQDTIIEDAYFESIANGVGGQCRFRVKDAGNIDADLYGFPTNRVPVGTFAVGLEIELRIDDVLCWSGTTISVERAYAFEVDDTSDPDTLQRFWAITGIDWNVLFDKRVVWNVANPTDTGFANFAGNEIDGAVVRQIMADYMDLSSDGLSDAGVHNVGPLSPYGEPFNIGNPGDKWGQVMNMICANNGTIFYIDPDKVVQYVDAETVSAPWILSDRPQQDNDEFGTNQCVGYREMQIALSTDGMANDVLMWGAGVGSDQMVFSRVTDDETGNEYGVWQYATRVDNVYQQTTLDARAKSYVYGSPTSQRGHRDPLPQIRVTTFQPGFRVGQVVSFISHVFDEDTDPSFTVTDPPGTVPANLANFMERIRHIESNNNYTDTNKSSGAYGAYQIMPGNWSVWGPEFLGTSRADAESSKWTDGATWVPSTSSANQDTVAAGKFTNLYDWLGDWRRVAAFWRAGHESIRQPSQWSPGTIFYVNHACVPLGFDPVTAATLLPPVGAP